MGRNAYKELKQTQRRHPMPPDWFYSLPDPHGGQVYANNPSAPPRGNAGSRIGTDATPPASSPAAAGNSTGGAPAPGEHGGIHERHARLIKAQALVAALLGACAATVGVPRTSEGWQIMADLLSERTPDFWREMALAAGVKEPSAETVAEVVAFFRRIAATQVGFAP